MTAGTFSNRYLLPPLRKGVPSLFADVKPLYASAEKATVMGELFTEWLVCLESHGRLTPTGAKEMPTSLLWVRMLVAQRLAEIVVHLVSRRR
jgi:peptide alpha-N-acetyltransferase